MKINGWRLAFCLAAAIWVGLWLFLLSNGFSQWPYIYAFSYGLMLAVCDPVCALGSGVAWVQRGFPS
jgi:hypothetical protein